jgi:hypothetical protein
MKNKQKKLLKASLFVCLCLMFTWLVNPALAEDDPALNPPESSDTLMQEGAEDFVNSQDSFGLETQDHWIAAMDFSPMYFDDTWSYQTFSYFYSPSGGAFLKGIELPWGARMTILEAWFNDTSGSDGRVYMYKNTQSGTSRNNITIGSAGTSGSGGFYQPYFTMNQLNRFRDGSSRNFYFLQAVMPATSAVSLRGVRIFWHREVRTGLPNPFTDIYMLNSRFQNAILALAESGITRGKTPTTFEPFTNVTRGEVAVFFAEALGLHWPY